MRRTIELVLGLAVCLSVALGVAMQPDDGTTVARPEGVGFDVDGANHAKPLPRIVSVLFVALTLSVAIGSVVRLVTASAIRMRLESRVERVPERPAFARAVPRRGPPALA